MMALVKSSLICAPGAEQAKGGFDWAIAAIGSSGTAGLQEPEGASNRWTCDM